MTGCQLIRLEVDRTDHLSETAVKISEVCMPERLPDKLPRRLVLARRW